MGLSVITVWSEVESHQPEKLQVGYLQGTTGLPHREGHGQSHTGEAWNAVPGTGW